jgi:hypothetical protein
MAFDVVRHIKSVQAVHADEQHMLNFAAFTEFVGGCAEGECSS